jgi:5-formyltetrahydrofolate cyclo-ligase
VDEIDLKLQKTSLRDEFRGRCEVFLVGQKALRLSAEIAGQLATVLSPFKAGLFAAYRPLKGEANPLMAMMQHQHLAWCFPRMEGEHLRFYRCDTGTRFTKNEWGVDEPDPASSEPVAIASLTGLLVPLAAFDQQGRRLGRGGGYYDRALEGFSGLKVGVGYSVQMSREPLPMEPHDVFLDLIVTESFIVQPRKRRKEKG